MVFFFLFVFSVFVFKPSEPRPVFSLKAVCSGKVTHAVFAPREEMLESCEESSQWLNHSQLYFLTQCMVRQGDDFKYMVCLFDIGTCAIFSSSNRQALVLLMNTLVIWIMINLVGLNLLDTISLGFCCVSCALTIVAIIVFIVFADVLAPLQDLMTFTTKAEEEKLMASSKQVQRTDHSRAVQVLPSPDSF